MGRWQPGNPDWNGVADGKSSSAPSSLEGAVIVAPEAVNVLVSVAMIREDGETDVHYEQRCRLFRAMLDNAKGRNNA